MSEQDMNQNTEFTTEDIQKNKTMAGLAYIIFFLPLIACPDSKFGRFHANQSLILLIISVAGNIVFNFLPVIGGILLSVLWIAVAVFAIMGLLNGLNGKAKELPFIGKFTILK